jgi:hypothetical protein
LKLEIAANQPKSACMAMITTSFVEATLYDVRCTNTHELSGEIVEKKLKDSKV